MLDEYRIEQMGVGAYVDSIDEEVITVDQAVQRAFCWSNEMINNLIYSTVSPKRIYIPNIILAEEKREDGLTTTYVVDGGQRTEALRRFVFDGHKISKSIRNRYVTYQGNKLDKNGKPMRDENGKLIKEIKTFDLVNKTYNDFPPELKKRMRSCQLSAAIYQECTPEDTCDLVMLYNSTIPMNVSQKAFTYIGTFADKIKRIKDNNRFLKDCTMLNELDKKKGIWERVIIECVMAMFHLEEWKKAPRDICKYLNENGTEEEFDTLNKYFNMLIPYADKLDHTEVAELFVSKDFMAWMTLMKRALDEGVSPENFGKFLIAFNDMKEIKVNDTDWIEIEQDKHTKDKKVIQQKIDYLHTLLVDFLHIKENKPNEDAESESIKDSSENSEGEESAIIGVDDRINQNDIDFVHTHVNEKVDPDDIEFYNECLQDTKVSANVYQQCKTALIALMVYAAQNNQDQEFEQWIGEYQNADDEYSSNQGINFRFMKRDFENFLVGKGNAA